MKTIALALCLFTVSVQAAPIIFVKTEKMKKFRSLADLKADGSLAAWEKNLTPADKYCLKGTAKEAQSELYHLLDKDSFLDSYVYEVSTYKTVGTNLVVRGKDTKCMDDSTDPQGCRFVINMEPCR